MEPWALIDAVTKARWLASDEHKQCMANRPRVRAEFHSRPFTRHNLDKCDLCGTLLTKTTYMRFLMAYYDDEPLSVTPSTYDFATPAHLAAWFPVEFYARIVHSWLLCSACSFCSNNKPDTMSRL